MALIKVTIGKITPENREAVDAALALFGLGPTTGNSYVALIELDDEDAETIGNFVLALSSLFAHGATVSIDIIEATPELEPKVLKTPPTKGPRLRV